MAERLPFRSGIGYDSHRFAPGGPLVLGGVEIDADVHLRGHSDGDAIAHAVTDAVLGAAGLGDIGVLFPETDPAWKDADSLQLLRDAFARVQAAAGPTIDRPAIKATRGNLPNISSLPRRAGKSTGQRVETNAIRRISLNRAARRPGAAKC